MPSVNRLRDEIASLFVNGLQIEVPSVDADLFAAGVLDSLTVVSLIRHLEDGFGVKIRVPDLTVDNFRSIARIAELIAARIDSTIEATATTAIELGVSVKG